MEKAFDFENMPVTGELEVYGKWSSNILKDYVVRYRAQDTGEEIADPTVGSALAGITRTFQAKGGSDLYAAYRQGCFPTVRSHSITIDVEDDANNSYTFWYVEKDAAPYTVKYLDADSGEPVAEEKCVSDNRQAVVTETFVPVSGMMPDAYQKRLVVQVDADGNPDSEGNVIVFYYTRDEIHARYKITHCIQSVDGTGWQEHASSQATGTIGQIYSAAPLTIPGFSFDDSVSGTKTSGELTADGLELKLYYTRCAYPYEVRYLESGSGKQLAEPKKGSALYQSVIAERAIEIDGYEAAAPDSQTMVIRIEQAAAARLNILSFYYGEREVAIRYVAVGPEGCGTVSPEREAVKVLSGTVRGSAPAANEGFEFVGWFEDADCTVPAKAAWVDADGRLIPVRAEIASLSSVSYYAKFSPALTSLTICKSISGTTEEDACFVFRVSGNGIDLDVTIRGGGSATIDGLTVGKTYTVREISGNWRYSLDASVHSVKMKSVGNSVSFCNTHASNCWLDDNAYSENKFCAVSER